MYSNMIFVTGNKYKHAEAEKILGRKIEQLEIGLPEIQSDSTEEIAAEKAKLAAEKIGVACFVEDSGLIFNAWGTFLAHSLNGF